jgi:hypothetical protein
MILSCLDYPFYSGASRRIDGFLSVFQSKGIRACVICPLFQRQSPPSDANCHNLVYVDLGIVKKLRYELLASRLIGLVFFSLKALPRIITLSRDYKVIQYLGAGSAFPLLLLRPILRYHLVIGDDFMPAYLRLKKPFAWAVALLDIMIVRMTDIIITYPAFWKTVSGKHVASKKVLHIPHGVSYIQPKEKLKQGTERNMVFVGSLTFEQNITAISSIFEMVRLLTKRELAFKVEIVGGPLECATRFLHEEAVKNGLINFRGFVTEDALHRIYSDSFIGLLPFFDETPSYSQKIKPLEYFANGLLVITGPQGMIGIRNLTNGRDYLEAKNIEEMADLVTECMKSPRSYWDIAVKGPSIARKYSWESLLTPYITMIEDHYSKENKR